MLSISHFEKKHFIENKYQITKRSLKIKSNIIKISTQILKYQYSNIFYCSSCINKLLF